MLSLDHLDKLRVLWIVDMGTEGDVLDRKLSRNCTTFDGFDFIWFIDNLLWTKSMSTYWQQQLKGAKRGEHHWHRSLSAQEIKRQQYFDFPWSIYNGINYHFSTHPGQCSFNWKPSDDETVTRVGSPQFTQFSTWAWIHEAGTCENNAWRSFRDLLFPTSRLR